MYTSSLEKFKSTALSRALEWNIVHTFISCTLIFGVVHYFFQTEHPLPTTAEGKQYRHRYGTLDFSSVLPMRYEWRSEAVGVRT